MKREIANQLKALIEGYGTSLCDDPRRCRALMIDLCGDYVQEINALTMAMQQGVPEAMLSSSDIPLDLVYKQLSKKMCDELGLEEDIARWTVEAWAFALELQDTLPGTPENVLTKQDECTGRKKQPVSAANEPVTEKPASCYAHLDADYYIDYEYGSIPIGDLPIGARVVDPSWEWEFRTGENYTGRGTIKPVTWIIVAKNHYEGLDPHVTFLSEELIGLFTFDDSTDRYKYGINDWGESGTGNAICGLRPWLNSNGFHAREGFYRAFSESFKQAVLTTSVPNREWENGSAYSTSDQVFVPSTTELNDEAHYWSCSIGSVYAYFAQADDEERMSRLDRGKWYWTRSPASRFRHRVRYVRSVGGFSSLSADVYNRNLGNFFGYNEGFDSGGVRPVLNIKSEILVSGINP